MSDPIWPPPQYVRTFARTASLPTPLVLEGFQGQAESEAEHFADCMRARGIQVEIARVASTEMRDGSVRLHFGLRESKRRHKAPPAKIPPDGYFLHVHSAIDVSADTRAGVRNALATLAQLCARMERTPSGLRGPITLVWDWPDFLVRGAMLDVSRTRVPTLETLYALVDRLAAFKVNQLQIYMEHTFAFEGHADVWRDTSPFTASEIDALDAFCARRGIELVPNQQSFGHMHRWLKHERYRALAELPEGVDHAFSIEKEPYSLDLSNPHALALLDDLYDQLLPHFGSRLFNVGLDETFDLGQGAAKAACAARGVERVYLEYLKVIREKVAARGHRMMFWGDIIVKRPELVRELPPDAIALEWGYDEGHPFAEHLKHFAASGLEFYVCPGTSSWQSVAGRTYNMLANLREAAQHGHAARARGYLVTDWGDRGHLQPHTISEAGLCAGAAFAWNARLGSALDRDRLARALDLHVYDDAASVMGALVLELGDAYRETGAASTNGSALFFLLAFAREPLPHARLPALESAGLVRAKSYLEARRPRIDAIRSRRADAETLASELRWIVDVLLFACEFGLARLATPPGSAVSAIEATERARLAAVLAPLVIEHRRLWSLRDRPGGLDESSAWLERVLALLTS